MHTAIVSDRNRFEHFPGLRCVAVLVLSLLYPAAIVRCQSAPSNSPSCHDRQLNITADSHFILYVDGREITGLQHPHNWRHSDTVRIVGSTRLLAVQIDIDEIVGGVLASLDNDDVLTDRSWKCTNELYPNWMTLDFDDLTWPNAHILCKHGRGHWGYIDGISHNASWITGPDVLICSNLPDVAYCRKTLDQAVVCRQHCNNGRSGRRCVEDCKNLPDGYYQSCSGCHAYISCSRQKTTKRRCSPKQLVWDDHSRRCQTTTSTCRCPHENDFSYD